MAATETAENHEINKAWHICNLGYMLWFQSGPTHKIQQQPQKYPLMEYHLRNYHEECLNQYEISHKLCDEKGHYLLSLKEHSPLSLGQKGHSFLSLAEVHS